MMRVFAAGAAAEFVLLLFLYRRLWIALIIIGSAVLSSGAVFIGLWITGVRFNITAMMGTVMIIGIATEMAIFFVSEFQSLEPSLPRREALQIAAGNRLRPIAMSSMAMILALLPLGQRSAARAIRCSSRWRLPSSRESSCSCRWCCWSYRCSSI